ncbi:MAG: twin-arginine translocase TatA/TatE family subunit [Fervidicoccaceae archaeon]
MPFSLGTTELIILGLIVVLLLLVPSKLPQLARGIGEAIREFRRASKEMEEVGEGVKREASKAVSDVKTSEEELRRVVTQILEEERKKQAGS